MSHRASLATARGIHLWKCWTVVCMECIILYSSGNKITTTTTKIFFFVTLPGGLVLCVPGQYQVFPPLAAIIAASRRGILATRRWRRCTGIRAHLSSRAWRSSSRFWGGLSIELIARPNSSQRCSMGLQSGDLGGCSIFVTLPCCGKSRTTLARWGVALSSW